MARKLRVEYPSAIYPIMNRGDRREAIFKDDKETAEAQAEEIIAAELKRRGWLGCQ